MKTVNLFSNAIKMRREQILDRIERLDLKIGNCHPISHWLTNYEIIGRKNGYSEEQIIEYKKYIDLFADFFAAGNPSVRFEQLRSKA